jgi:hypothetical protein
VQPKKLYKQISLLWACDTWALLVSESQLKRLTSCRNSFARNLFGITWLDHREQALQDWANRTAPLYPVTDATDQYLYALDEVQADWLLPQYRQPRFQRATEDPSNPSVLYRPGVVKELFEFVQNCPNYNGVMVRGPQGIGKSFTLLNLYRRLVSEGHLVAFLPQTALAVTNSMYAEAIAQGLGFPELDIDVSDFDKMRRLVKKTVAGLPQDKNFYFIFDQINEVFAPTPTRKMSQLLAPHHLMNDLRTLGCVPIISASANNLSAYKDNHEGFMAWDHPISMDDTELQALYPNFVVNGDTCYLTGKVPLQITECENAESTDAYETDTRISVTNSLFKLLDESSNNDTKAIRSACAHTVLGLPMLTPRVFDRKSSTLSRVDNICRPLFPLVKEIYRETCTIEVMELTRQNEDHLGAACHDP